MDYSRTWFSRKVKDIFGRTPKEILAQTRLKLVKEEILEDPEVIGYKIAISLDLNDGKVLHKFLISHFFTTLTGLREELL